MKKFDPITLQNYDTTVAAKNFAEMLSEENKTYFLNGKWGSGKTKFLEKTASNCPNKKFVYLDLWRIKDERTVTAIAFHKIFPISSWILKFLFIVSVVISILMSNIVNLGLSEFLKQFLGSSINELIISFAGLIALFIATWSFFKVKSDAIYGYVILFLLKLPCPVKKVLIIDDFDRVCGEKQEQAYLLFNLIEGKIPIVFLGDYDKLTKDSDNYLQKIIDKRIELPHILNTKNIWKEYFKQLEKYGLPDNSKLFSIILEEERNLRDRKHFNNYVTQEFSKQGKWGHVQFEQQLWIIYIYLFHPKYYNVLVQEHKIELSDEINQARQTCSSAMNNLNVKHKILDVLDLLQNNNSIDDYPPPFSYNREPYLLYENFVNRSEYELKEVFEKKEKLREEIFSNEDTDLYQYLSVNYKTFDEKTKENMLSLALEQVKTFQDSGVIRYIITEKSNEIMPEIKYLGNNMYTSPQERLGKNDEEITKEKHSKWEPILIKEKFDNSMEIYFFFKYGIFNFNDIQALYPNVDIENSSYSDQIRQDFVLLVHLLNKGKREDGKKMWEEPTNWEEYIFDYINNMKDEQCLSFLILQKIISNDKSLKDFDFIPENNTFYCMKNQDEKEDLEGKIKIFQNQKYTFEKKG